ncbi:MAG: PDZ domain-containing protein, partial [Noviherbaspirillum sp.]
LWQRYGRDFYSGAGGTGVTEAEAEALFDEVTGLKLKRFFDRYVRGTGDLPLAKLLTPFAVESSDKRKNDKPSLGIRTTRDGNDCKMANVYEGGAAHAAGISAGDILLAVDGLRVSASNLDTLLSRYRVGDALSLHAFRRDELMNFDVTLANDDAPQTNLTVQAKPAAAARLRAAWLGVKSGR